MLFRSHRRQKGGLLKRTVRLDADKDGPACRKWKSFGPPFSATQFNVHPPARLNVQPTGPSCSAACRPALLAARQPPENSCFSFVNTALQPARPAGPSFSVIHQLEPFVSGASLWRCWNVETPSGGHLCGLYFARLVCQMLRFHRL